MGKPIIKGGEGLKFFLIDASSKGRQSDTTLPSFVKYRSQLEATDRKAVDEALKAKDNLTEPVIIALKTGADKYRIVTVCEKSECVEKLAKAIEKRAPKHASVHISCAKPSPVAKAIKKQRSDLRVTRFPTENIDKITVRVGK